MNWKIIPLAVIFLFSISLANAAIISSSDANGWNIYDDFSSLNLSFWGLGNQNVFGISAGALQNLEGYSNSWHSIYPIGNEFIVHPEDEWTITMSARGFSAYQWASVLNQFQNGTGNPGTGMPKYYGRITNYGDTSASHYYLWEGSLLGNNDQDSGSIANGLNNVYNTFKMTKTNNDDGTFNLTVYRNDILLEEFQSVYTTSDFADDLTYHLVVQSQDTSNHHVEFDWINITVIHTAEETGYECPNSSIYCYYDDFEYSSLNTSIWDDYNNRFTIVDGDLRCNPDGVALRFMEFLDFDKFNTNNWVIEYELTLRDVYASHIAGFMNETAQVYAGATSTYLFFADYGGGSSNTDFYLTEKWNGTTTNHDYPDVDTTEALGVIRYEKTNLDDGTINAKFYQNDTLELEVNSTHPWVDLGEDQANKMIFWCNQNSNNDWAIEWLNITVYPSEEPATPEVGTCDPTYLDSHVVAYYIANETGLDYDNAQGNSNLDLTIGNVPDQTIESYGYGMDFEASNSDYLATGKTSDVELTTLTVGLHYKPESSAPDHEGLFSTLYNPGGINHRGVYFQHRQTNNLVLYGYYDSSVPFRATSSTTIADDVDVYLVGIMEAGQASRIFIDNTEVSYTEQQIGTMNYWTGNHELEISGQDLGDQQFADGVIGNLVLLDVALNESCRQYIQDNTYPYITEEINETPEEPCTPDWSCTGFETCIKPAAVAYCDQVQDANDCGEAYTGSYTEFGTIGCQYSTVSEASSTKSINYSLCMDDGTCYDDEEEAVLAIFGEPDKKASNPVEAFWNWLKTRVWTGEGWP